MTQDKKDPPEYVPVPDGSTVKIGFNPSSRDVLYVKVEPPAKKYAVNGRKITLGEWYDGHGPDDPPGRYYTYDDEPHVTHWMSSRAMPIRMKEVDE